MGVAAFLVGITPLGLHTLVNPMLAVAALLLAAQPWPTLAFRPIGARRTGRAGATICPRPSGPMSLTPVDAPVHPGGHTTRAAEGAAG